LLKKAETFTTTKTGLEYSKRLHQRVATYQAFACYYRRQKKYQAALQYIKNASKCNQKLLSHERFAIVEFLHGNLLYQAQKYPLSLNSYNMCYEIAQKHFQQVPIDKRPATHHILMVATLHNLTITRVSHVLKILLLTSAHLQ
jgi:tetratricopeptide (TPR) repeat protein